MKQLAETKAPKAAKAKAAKAEEPVKKAEETTGEAVAEE